MAAICAETKSDILRYHYVEKWKVGTIAKQLGVHHTTVKRVLANNGVTVSEVKRKPSMIDPYLPFLMSTLEKFPTLTAARLFEMVKERGYEGGPDHFRHLISLYRPRRTPEAFHRLKTYIGEEGQVDWGHMGSIRIGNAERKLMAFVMVLSWSRQIYLRFFPDAGMGSFLRGHVGALNAWGGVPRILLYDNLRSAVLERRDDNIRFHPTLYEFSGGYF